MVDESSSTRGERPWAWVEGTVVSGVGRLLENFWNTSSVRRR